MGCSTWVLGSFWRSTAPTPEELASICKMNGPQKLGVRRTGLEERRVFKWLKDASQAGVQWKGVLGLVRSVRGATMEAKLGQNLP